MIRHWLKAGVLEDGQVEPSEQGTPQGGSISVLLSNLYLHFVLDLWFERVVKRRLRGEARLVRYIDDFVICFQYRSDAIRVQEALRLRLGKFGLTLEPTKTKLVEFGRFAQRHAGKRGRKRPETIYFLRLALYCTRNLKGNFKVGMRTEKSRLRRSLLSLQELMRQIRHYTIGDQVGEIDDRPTPPLCLLRCRRESSVPCKGVPRRGALLETDVVQPQLGRATLDLGEVQPDQREDAVTETKAAPPLPGVAGSCSAVNHLPKSVVREIRTLRSVETGGGRPPPVTRWAASRDVPLSRSIPKNQFASFHRFNPRKLAISKTLNPSKSTPAQRASVVVHME